jgi:hypothetical protein
MKASSFGKLFSFFKEVETPASASIKGIPFCI